MGFLTRSRLFVGPLIRRVRTSPNSSNGNVNALPLPKFAVFIDGDEHGPSRWASALASVRTRGSIERACVFCTPAMVANQKWSSTSSNLGIELIPVPRKTGGGKDPNDIAIAIESAIAVCSGKADGVALVASDADFVYIAKRLGRLEYAFLSVLSNQHAAAVSDAYRAADADVVRFDYDGVGGGKSNIEIILQSDGTSVFQARQPIPGPISSTVPEDVIHEVANLLCDLDYMSTMNDPLIPAIVRFFIENGLGAVPVWPGHVALNALCEVRKNRPNYSWQRSSGDAVFVLPQGQSTTKSDVAKYGSRTAARLVRGGGPFALLDTPSLTLDFLRRLGYLDDTLNCDLSEAIDVFQTMNLNRASLMSLGLSIPTYIGAHSKQFTLHSALISPRSFCRWQPAPKDALVRSHFRSEGLINDGDTREHMFAALRMYCQKRSLPEHRTYNRLVLEVMEYLDDGWPTKRH